MKVNNGILFTSVVKQVNAAAVGIGNTQYNSLYALGQAAREHCHAELVSASHLVRLLDTILSRSGAQASLEVTLQSVFCISTFVFFKKLLKNCYCRLFILPFASGSSPLSFPVRWVPWFVRFPHILKAHRLHFPETSG